MKLQIYIFIYILIQLVRKYESSQQLISSQCFNTQYFNDQENDCKFCQIKCDRCIEESDCIGCSIGFKQDGSCLGLQEKCIEGFYLNESLKKCKQCEVPFCQSCSSESKCDECLEGFILQNKIECIRDESSNLSDKFYKYACDSMQQDNQGSCINQEICSTFTFKQDISFSENVKVLLENMEFKYIIAMSSSQVLVFNMEQVSYLKELLSLPNTQQEQFLSVKFYKQALFVLSTKTIFIFNLQTLKLMNKYPFSQDQIQGNPDLRQIIVLEEEYKLIYFDLSSNWRNIKKYEFNIFQDGDLMLNISLIKDNAQNTYLINNEEGTIIQFYYYHEYKLISVMTFKQVYFLDLSTLKKSNIEVDAGNMISQMNAIYLQKQGSINNDLLIFYAIKQATMDLTILQIITTKDGTILGSTYFYTKKWQFFQEMKQLEYSSFSWFINEINQQWYIMLLAHSVHTTPYLGIAEIDYFHPSQTLKHFSFEQFGSFLWTTGSTPLLSDFNSNNSFLLLLPYQNSIQIFEIKKESNQMNKLTNSINFDQTNSLITIYQSIQSVNMFSFMLGKIIGQFQWKEETRNIELKISSKILFNSKGDLFYEFSNNQDIKFSRNINEDKDNYQFIIIQFSLSYKISVIQTQFLPNGEQIFLAQKQISLSSENTIVDVFHDNIEEILQIETVYGIFLMKYHSLLLDRFIPIQNYINTNLGVYLYAQVISEIQFQTKALLISRTGQDKLVNIQKTINLQSQIRANLKQKDVFFIYQKGNLETESFLLLYYLGFQIDLFPIYFINCIVDKIKFLSQNEIGIQGFSNFEQKMFFQKISISIQNEQLVTDSKITLFLYPALCYLEEYVDICICISTTIDFWKSLLIFDWNTMSFFTNEDGSLLEQNLVENDNKNDDYFLSLLTNIIFEKEKYKIYILFQRKILNSSHELVSMNEICTTRVVFDPLSKSMKVYNYFSIIQKSSQIITTDIQEGAQMVYFSEQGKNRNLFFDKFFLYTGFLETGESFVIQKMELSKTSFSLLFQFNNQLINAQRYGQFEIGVGIEDIIFVQFINQLGLILGKQNYDTLVVLSLDKLQILYSIPLEFNTDILWSNKFNTLILIDKLKMRIYKETNKFDSPIIKDLNLQQGVVEKTTCSILEETPMITCHKIGLYDFNQDLWYHNYSLVLYGQRRKIYSRDNLYYAIFNEVNNLFIFSHEIKSFLQNQSIQYSSLLVSNLYLNNNFKDQAVFIEQDKSCVVYSLPNFYEIFKFQVNATSSRNNDRICIYNEINPSLIIKIENKVLIYKLPYSLTDIPRELPSFNIGDSYLITNNYLYIISSQNFIDLSKLIQLDCYSLEIGTITTKQMVLTEKIERDFVFWEEKDIIFQDGIIISLGKINFGWSSDNSILGYSERFNYLITQNKNNLYFQTTDVSDMFPLNDKSALLINQLKIQNQNIYLNELNEKESVIHFNYQQMKVIRSSLNTEEQQNLLDLYEIQDRDVHSGLKSSHQLFQINNSNQQNVYGIVWKCRLTLFQQERVLKNIELLDYKCQISKFGVYIYLLSKYNSLEWLIYKNNSIQIYPMKLQNNYLIDSIYSDNESNWIFVNHKSSQNDKNPNSILYKNQNLEQDLLFKIINLPSSSITFVRFLAIRDLTLLIIGQVDSSLKILKPVLGNSDSIQISTLYENNFDCGQIKLLEYYVKSSDQNNGGQNYSIYFYITCKTRIYYLQADYKNNDLLFQTDSIKYNLIHTRQGHKIKIKAPTFVFVFSSLQITIYSLNLQYIGRIEDQGLSSINDVLLAPNLFSIFVTSDDGIFVYNTKIFNSKQRLILQNQFPYSMPILFSVTYFSSNNNILSLKGVDLQNTFNIKYSPNYTESSSSSKSNCLIQIKSIDSEDLQFQQYSSLLINQQYSSTDELNVFLSVLEGQQSILLPTKTETLIDDLDKKYFQSRINLDSDLQKRELILSQNTKARIQQNLLKSLKISNGIIKVKQSIVLNQMDSLIFKDLSIIFEDGGQFDLSNIKEVKLDNCQIQYENEKIISYIYLFNFNNITNTIFYKININSQVTPNINLLSFVSCTNTLIRSLTIEDSEFLSDKPYLSFQEQSGNITIQDVLLENSSCEYFLQFKATQNIILKQFIFKKLSSTIANLRNLNEMSSNQQIPFPLIKFEYTLKSVLLTQIELEDCELNQLIDLKNWVFDVKKSSDGQEITVKRYSSDSQTTIDTFNIKSSKFINGIGSFEENKIILSNANLNSNQDGFLKLINSNLEINNLISDKNIIKDKENLIIIEKSIVKITTLGIYDTQKYASTSVSVIEGYSLSQNGYLLFTQSQVYIKDLKAISNKIFNYLISINGYSKDEDVTNKVEIKGMIEDCRLEKTEEGGGIQVYNLKQFTIQNGFISENSGASKGGGMSLILTEQSYLINVEIISNIASNSGGAIYMEDSDLSLQNSHIRLNTAAIGGGIRYNNTQFKPTFLSKQLNQIYENTARIFGNNYCSFPQKLQILNDNIKDNIHIIEAVSSLSQQPTIIKFQLYDEEGGLVRLPNYINLFDPVLMNELQPYYNFKLSSLTTNDEQIQIQQNNINSQYDDTQNTHYFSKFILESGYNNQVNLNLTSNQIYQFKIQNQIQSLNSVQFGLKFRKCAVGEVIKLVGRDFYECWKCQDNTYSLTDPYSNKEISCNECPKGGKSCSGSQIVPLDGFWIEQGSSTLYECTNTPDICQYQNLTTPKFCVQGYTGPLCESCDYHNNDWQLKNQYFAKKGKYKCTLCSDKISMRYQILLSVLLALGFLMYLTYQITANYKKKIVKLQYLYLKRAELLYISNSINSQEQSQFAMKILIGYFQIIGIIFQYQIKVPESAKSVFFLGNSLETTIYSVDCVLAQISNKHQVNMVYLRLLWTLISPLCYILFLTLIFITVQLFVKIKSTNRIKNLFVSGLLKIYYMVYPGVILQIIGSFSCKKINDKSYVLLDSQYYCYDDQYYTYNFTFGLPMIILALLTPFFIMRKLMKNKDRITEDPNIFISYGFYFSEYRNQYCYWEIIKIYQKIFIYILVGVLNENKLISSILVSVIILIYIKFQLKIYPFTYYRFNELDHLSQLTAIITILSLVINYNTENGATALFSLIIIILFNIYFFVKFITCFTYHAIRKQNLEFFVNFLKKVQQIFNKFIPPINIHRDNLIRLSKNWKIIKKHIVQKNLDKIYCNFFKSRLTLGPQTITSLVDINEHKVNTERGGLLETSQQFTSIYKMRKQTDSADFEDNNDQEHIFTQPLSVRTQPSIMPGSRMKLQSISSDIYSNVMQTINLRDNQQTINEFELENLKQNK